MNSMADPLKIGFELENNYFAEAEHLWANPHPEGGYVIDSVPFFVPGVSLGDRVEAENLDGHLWATSILQKGPFATVRVMRYASESKKDLAALESLVPGFRELGAEVEVDQETPLLSLSFLATPDSMKLRSRLHGLYRNKEIALDESDVPDWWIRGE